MTIAGNRVLISQEGQPTTCCRSGETGPSYLVCPKRRRGGSAESTGPTPSWADIAVRGTRSPRDDGGEKEPGAGQQVGQGGGRHAGDGDVVQVDNANATDVTSERSERSDREDAGGSGVRSEARAPKKERRSVEYPTERGEMADDTRHREVLTHTSTQRTRVHRGRRGTYSKVGEDGRNWEVGRWIGRALNRTR